jgi:hypothetical protein
MLMMTDVITSLHSSSLLLHTSPHSSSTLLLTPPPHFSSLLLHTPPPQKSGSIGLYITTNICTMKTIRNTVYNILYIAIYIYAYHHHSSFTNFTHINVLVYNRL